MSRLLVTGAGGFIGRWCMGSLRDRFPTLHGVSRGTSSCGTDSCGTGESDATEWHTCDLLTDDIESLCHRVRPTHLLHLAWIATPGLYWTSPLNERWCEASRRLLDAFIDCGGRRFVGTGTCAEYDWTNGICHEKETPLVGRSPYAESKIQFFEHASRIAENASIEFAWARLFFVYGPGEPSEKLYSSVIRGVLRGQTVTCSAGTQRRDFVFVKNVAAALTQLVDSHLTGAINIGSGTAVTVRELVEPVAQQLGRPDLVQFTRSPASESPRVQADVTRLHDEMGFQEKYDASAAREDTIACWQAENLN